MCNHYQISIVCGGHPSANDGEAIALTMKEGAMVDTSNWDWEVGKKPLANTDDWKDKFEWVEEFQASPDGEKVAAIVKTGEGEFSVCENGAPWGNAFDKCWHLRYSPDGRAACFVSADMEWTVAVDGTAWENTFAYAWNMKFSQDGKTIAAAVQQDMKYGAVVNGEPWENLYPNMTNFTLSPDGNHTAGAVQTVTFAEAEIFKFQEGCYSAAADGKVWDNNFVNVWNMAFSADGSKLAAEARTSLYDYTIVVNGVPWSDVYGCVWQPIINPKTGAVVAPVLTGGKWTLAQDGQILWSPGFVQCWHQMFSPDGSRLAAIVAVKYGKWTMAVDGQAWQNTFAQMVSDPLFSPDGGRVAACGRDGGSWTVIVDDMPWNDMYDMVWEPVFSPDGRHVAAKVRKDGKYTVVIDGKPWSGASEQVWSPRFSPDGNNVLIRSIEDGGYVRHVVPVTNITG